MNKIAVVVLLLGVAVALPTNDKVYTLPNGLGDGLWRTFSKAMMGSAPALPLSAAEAEKAGWIAQNNGACVPQLGVLYSKAKEGGSKNHPLSIYYAANGQVAGVNVNVFGHATTSDVGPAAPSPLVALGLWQQTATAEVWTMSMSFRDGASLCDKAAALSDLVLGDRLVINQDTIGYSIPLTVVDAKAAGFVRGSCMKTMGQHFFEDVTTPGAMSWNATYLLPVVPMYYPTDITGTINAFFFTSPVVQPGSLSVTSAGDWEFPPLPVSAMCQNWCDDKCTWNTKAWSTMHIYLNSQFKTLTCDGGSGMVGRSCPKDE